MRVITTFFEEKRVLLIDLQSDDNVVWKVLNPTAGMYVDIDNNKMPLRIQIDLSELTDVFGDPD